ncbi:MAG: DUF2141 domain-containing protein [Rhodospirillaceae bacterium]|nr:DUF2141 domain-containing protein [Rhodospirillaceae bacterium]MCY4065930.1 DUF2141 domain-containing protein [Rhodospirillaceae bacterium]
MKRIFVALAAHLATGAVLSGLPALASSETRGAAQAAELTVAVTGVNSGKGRIYVALHRATAGVKFPDMKGAVAGAWRTARKGGFSVTFTGLEPGRYAVNGFHDANGNGDLDTNLLGIPTEGYGFGNGATGTFGPASFDASSIALKDAATIRLPIGYAGSAGSTSGESSR